MKLNTTISSGVFELKEPKPSRVTLSHTELMYLRLFAHGLTTQEISMFLEVDATALKNILAKIKYKFNTANCFKIILQALQEKQIDTHDYIEDTVKENALDVTLKAQQYFKTDNTATFNPVFIKQKILEFYYAAEIALAITYLQKTDTQKLTTLEEDYINLRFSGMPNRQILNVLQISGYIKRRLIASIFAKLEATNWYIVFKKAIHINVFEKSAKHHLMVEKEIDRAAKKVVLIKASNTLTFKEKKLSFYRELLEVFSNIELKYLASKNPLINENIESSLSA